MRSDRGNVVLVVAPHPDDEVIGCGGTIIKKIAEGYRVKLIFTTDGSRSHAAVLNILADPAPEELARVRHYEALNAAGVLGIHQDDIYFLDAEDTKLHLSRTRISLGIFRILSRNIEAREIYIPHDQRELNSDHRLTGQLVLDCVNKLGMKARVFKYVVWDENTEQEFAFVNRGDLQVDRTAEEEVLLVDVREQLSQKREALNEHRTQMCMFWPSQTRTVVPPNFKRRVETQENERFFIHTNTMVPEVR